MESPTEVINPKMESPTEIISILEEYIKKYYHKNLKDSHFTTMVDTIYMAALRCKITISELIKDLYNGIFDTNLFLKSKSGKGEWLISIGCGINPKTKKPNVNIIKSGEGDLQYVTNKIVKNEEVKLSD